MIGGLIIQECLLVGKVKKKLHLERELIPVFPHNSSLFKKNTSLTLLRTGFLAALVVAGRFQGRRWRVLAAPVGTFVILPKHIR